MGQFFSTPFLQTVFFVTTAAAAIAGGIGIVAALMSALSGYVITDRAQREADVLIAEAKGEAARANEATETLRAANLALEAKIAPRRLTPEQQKALSASLEPFRGRKIRVESYSLDAEGEILAAQIRDALGRIFTIDDWVGAERGSNGFAKGVNVTGTDGPLVTKLAESLEAVGLSEVSTVPLPPPQQAYLMLEQSRDKATDVAAVILVGVKPLPQPEQQ
jgi:hypothetical protein